MTVAQAKAQLDALRKQEAVEWDKVQKKRAEADQLALQWQTIYSRARELEAFINISEQEAT